jgi:hypothetical protein
MIIKNNNNNDNNPMKDRFTVEKYEWSPENPAFFVRLVEDGLEIGGG